MIEELALLVVSVMLPAAVPVVRAKLPLPPCRVVAEEESVEPMLVSSIPPDELLMLTVLPRATEPVTPRLTVGVEVLMVSRA